MAYANQGPMFSSYYDRPASFMTTIDEESRSSTYESVLTHTTSSTVPGPGSLTGKAIKALGELALRGLDRLIIYARFQAILSKFPHTDSEVAGIKDIDGIYNVILELSRPGLYSKDLRNAALTLIITQLNRGHSHQLEKALAHWNIVELELFFSGMSFHSSPQALPSLHDVSSYPAVAPDPTRLISTMSRVVLLNRRACQALHAQLFELFLLLDEEQFSSVSLADFFRVVLHVVSSEDQIYEAKGQALNLFELLVSRPEQPFIMALAQWHFSDFRLLISFFSHQCSASRDISRYLYIDSILGCLCRIACFSSAACWNLLAGGYLKFLYFLQALDIPLPQIASDEQFNILLLVLKDEPSVYTAEEKGKVFELLVSQITYGSPNLSFHRQLDEWNCQELTKLLLMLTTRLSQMITDNPASQLNGHLTTFIFEVALCANQQVRQAVIKAGFLEILSNIEGEVSGLTILILDVLPKVR